MEADAVLVIDADTVLSSPVAPKTLETVSWRYRQIAQFPHAVDLVELPPGEKPQDARTNPPGHSRVAAVEDILGPAISKRTYHASHYNGCRYNCQCASCFGAGRVSPDGLPVPGGRAGETLPTFGESSNFLFLAFLSRFLM